MLRNNLLDELWAMPTRKLFAVAVLLVPVSMVATAAMTYLIDFAFNLDGLPPNASAELARTGITTIHVVSALFLAPVIENALCSLWSVWLDEWGSNHWWKKPVVIAAIAAFFHVLLLWDLRPFGVFPGFFVMSALIVNVKNRKAGYWASVLHHAGNNFIGLSVAYFLARP